MCLTRDSSSWMGRMKLTVGDMFCGAGGFAEGFRQAGFRIAWAVDNWKSAVRTFKKNHRTTRVIPEDVMELNLGALEPVDVLIGSPPCTHFSLANRGGNGDRAAGMKYVIRFFEAVQVLKPRYWIMENVPNLGPEIEQILDGDHVGLSHGAIVIPRREVLLASEYGAPQTRKRLFCGAYPIPEKVDPSTLGSRATLGGVLGEIPAPCHQEGRPTEVQDPIYPFLRVPHASLRAHYDDERWSLTAEEVDECEMQKREHRVYGSMSFPDRLDKPARTITSTRVHRSRSAIIIPCGNQSHPKPFFRTLTARECASVQTFPITYQFWPAAVSEVDRLVGNAVPPAVSYALAKALLRAEGLKSPDLPIVCKSTEPAPPLRMSARRFGARYPVGRHFQGMCKCEWSHDRRVELDNSGSHPAGNPATEGTFDKEWVTRLYLGYAKMFKGYELNSMHVQQIIQRVVKSWPEGVLLRPALLRIVEEAARVFPDSVPDSATLQQNWSGRGVSKPSPLDVVNAVDAIVDRHLPRKTWSNVPIPSAIYATSLASKVFAIGSRAEPGCPKDLTVRMLGAALALSIACNHINRRPDELDATGPGGVIRLGVEPST